jgi:hypothetical protein
MRNTEVHGGFSEVHREKKKKEKESLLLFSFSVFLRVSLRYPVFHSFLKCAMFECAIDNRGLNLRFQQFIVGDGEDVAVEDCQVGEITRSDGA